MTDDEHLAALTELVGLIVGLLVNDLINPKDKQQCEKQSSLSAPYSDH